MLKINLNIPYFQFRLRRKRCVF